MKLKFYYEINKARILWAVKITGIIMSVISVFIMFAPMFLGKEKMESLEYTISLAITLFVGANLFGLLLILLAFFDTYFKQKNDIELSFKEEFSEIFNLKLLVLEGNPKMNFIRFKTIGFWDEASFFITVERTAGLIITKKQIKVQFESNIFLLTKDILKINKRYNWNTKFLGTDQNGAYILVDKKDWQVLTSGELEEKLVQLKSMNSQIIQYIIEIEEKM
ncbi:MAG: hypothetical protein E6767_08690 [Dysgonomonas sp.]|nr:hypothetical protein [Dysgonomonas sp.]